MTQFTPHLSDLHEQFDVYIIDLWGVLHNGKAAFKEAVNALEHLKRLNKSVILLSNAPRRLAPAQQRLNEMGITPDLYHHIYTSGEDCYRHLKDRLDPWYQDLGNRLFHVGPERDRNLFDDLPYQEVKDLADADFILNTGTSSWDSKLQDYEDLLCEALYHNLPMICPNPDKVVMYGEQKALCAGAIADRYQELGGFVRYHGKPFADIYTAILKLCPGVALQRILAIGDSLTTDIHGAKSAKIQALMIMGGIHQHHFIEEKSPLNTLQKLAELHPSTPDFLAPYLSW